MMRRHWTHYCLSLVHKHSTFEPHKMKELSWEAWKEVLNLMTMLKEKMCGKIKVRACADRRNQRSYIAKEDMVSPTVELESLILSLIVNVKEVSDVAIADVVGAYILTNMEDYELLNLTGKSVKIICEVSS